MHICGIVPGFNVSLVPSLCIEILQRMVLFAGKTEKPVTCRTGGDVCLIHTVYGETAEGLSVHGTAGFLVNIKEGASVLVNHDAVFMKGAETVSVKLRCKHTCCMSQRICTIANDDIVLVLP